MTYRVARWGPLVSFLGLGLSACTAAAPAPTQRASYPTRTVERAAPNENQPAIHAEVQAAVPAKPEGSAGPAEVPPPTVDMPLVRETVIGYQSPDVQGGTPTHQNKYRWGRAPCKSRTGPQFCVPGYHEFCKDVTFEGHVYRVNVSENSASYAVHRDKEVVYRGRYPANWVQPPIYNLSIWQGKWVLEVNDELIVDGVNFNQEQGYRRVFGWVVWRGYPFYFFEKDGVVQISYADTLLPLAYGEVTHNLCCSLMIHNVGLCDEAVTFYAKRGPKWYYVELTFPLPGRG